MYICDDQSFIFLAQPRTASRATRDFLNKEFNVKKKGNHHHVCPVTTENAKSDGYKVISVVRNHWDYIVSWWHKNPELFNETKKPRSFYEYVKDFATHEANGHVKPHRLYWRYQPVSTHIARYESLWEDLADILDVDTTPYKSVYVGRSANRNPYRDYYTDTAAAWLRGYYRDEITQYGYEF